MSSLNATSAPSSAARPAETDGALLVKRLPNGKPDWDYNGALLGRGGVAYSPGTSVSDVMPVVPDKGAHRPTGDNLLFVGGITRSKENVGVLMQKMANDTGASVVGVHNATSATDASGVTGAPLDVLESSADYKEMLGHRAQTDTDINVFNEATSSLSDVIDKQLSAGKKVNLAAESQGALITSNALSRLEDRLLSRFGYNPLVAPWDAAGQQKNKDALSKTQATLANVEVTTFNGAASYYPSGPNYTHVRNTNDFAVARALGMGQPGADGGAGSRQILINKDHGNPMQNHIFPNLWADLSPRQREAATR
jgi:hypothetical protein